MMRKQISAGRERLAKLATFLYRVPRARFNMMRWKGHGAGTLSLNENECNTQGCAIGWATVLFADVGFCLKPDESYSPNVPLPKWGQRQGWGAIKAFLDLPTGIATALFSNTQTTAKMGPRQVAVRIRRFLKTGRV